MNQDFKLSSIEGATGDFRAGELVIVVDNEDRENEGDFITAAELITPEKVNFMMRYGREVLYTPTTEDRAAQPELSMRVHENTSLHETSFTVTVGLVDHGYTTGVSVYDRAITVKVLANPNIRPTNLTRLGHINPLRARNRGVLRRVGHAGVAIDLVRLVGLQPVDTFVGIINEDGMMTCLPQLVEIARQWNIRTISIEDLIAYRLKTDCIVEEGVKAKLPTEWGMFDIIPFRQKSNSLEHITLIKGDISTNKPAFVRMHSSCATGDVFGSLCRKCGEQLHKTVEITEQEDAGVIAYPNRGGRGIGSMDKIRAYKFQDEGFDTVDANLHLGHKVNERDYGAGTQILRAIGVIEMRLMTNNLVKRAGLEAYELKVVETVSLEIKPNQYSTHYLYTKKMRVGRDLYNIK